MVKKLSALILVLYMGVVFCLSVIPDAGTGHTLLAIVPKTVQKLGHLLAFGFLALLWILTLRVHGVAEYHSVRIALILSSGYGAMTELYQIWVPGRSSSLWDLLVDIAGSLLFIALYRKVTREGFFTLGKCISHVQHSDS